MWVEKGKINSPFYKNCPNPSAKNSPVYFLLGAMLPCSTPFSTSEEAVSECLSHSLVCLPAVLACPSVGVCHWALLLILALVHCILPSLGGSPEECLAGVAADPAIVHVSNC